MSNRRLPNGLLVREEQFALAYMAHGNISKAYEEAGYVTDGKSNQAVWKNAMAVLQRPAIQERIKQLQQRAEVRALYTHTQADADLNEAFIIAKEQRDPKAMSAVVERRAKLAGLEPQDENDKLNRDLKDLSIEELDAELARIKELERAIASQSNAPALGGEAGAPSHRKGSEGASRKPPSVH